MNVLAHSNLDAVIAKFRARGAVARQGAREPIVTVAAAAPSPAKPPTPPKPSDAVVYTRDVIDFHSFAEKLTAPKPAPKPDTEALVAAMFARFSAAKDAP